ncbi:hypothetical protein [Photobacterium nomapromontoriensis]|uniref:hypothetical protein n=1 Tax=Photobacterium nomapromontoriensis TaxID=2910237 RepID=UPI003D123488
MRYYWFIAFIPFMAVAGAQPYSLISLDEVAIPEYSEHCSSIVHYENNSALGICKFSEMDSADDYG